MRLIPVEIQACIPQIESLIEAAGVELVDLEHRRRGSSAVLTVIADKKGGITLEDCATINRQINAYLETVAASSEADFWKRPRFVEVNSPGLDRPLRTVKDFSRAAGKRVKVLYKDEQDKIRQMIVAVGPVAQDAVTLITESGVSQALPLSRLVKAVIEIDFGPRGLDRGND